MRKLGDQKNPARRSLNSYNRSHDGKCEWCMEPSLFLECDVCVVAVAQDEAVKLAPTKKAKCGHLSHNYFECEDCRLDGPEAHTKDLYNFCREVQAYDLRKLGATHANGTLEDMRSRGPLKETPPFFCPDDDAVRLTTETEEI